jgi:hypothetical protein
MNSRNPHVELALRELGEPEAIYHISLPRFLALMTLSLLLLLVGLLINYLWWVHGPQKIDHLAILLLFPPVLGLVVLGRLLRQRGLMVLLYPTGLLSVCRGQAQVFLWQEVDQVLLHFHHLKERIVEHSEQGQWPVYLLRPTASFSDDLLNSWLTLVRQDGQDMQITPAVSRYHDLVLEVQRRTFPLLWQRAWDQLQEQGFVTFGPLLVSWQGLHWSQAVLPWNQFDSLRIHKGKLIIRQKKLWKTWRSTSVNTLPNLPIFWGLVEQLHRAMNQVVEPSASHPVAAETDLTKPEAPDEMQRL